MKITRSFGRKLNMRLYGGKDYETADFFCEAEEDVVFGSDPAQNELLKNGLSTMLFKFCKDEVLKAMNEYVKEIKKTS